jgi:hypothetical protein
MPSRILTVLTPSPASGQVPLSSLFLSSFLPHFFFSTSLYEMQRVHSRWSTPREHLLEALASTSLRRLQIQESSPHLPALPALPTSFNLGLLPSDSHIRTRRRAFWHVFIRPFLSASTFSNTSHISQYSSPTSRVPPRIPRALQSPTKPSSSRLKISPFLFCH